MQALGLAQIQQNELMPQADADGEDARIAAATQTMQELQVDLARAKVRPLSQSVLEGKHMCAIQLSQDAVCLCWDVGRHRWLDVI